MLLMLLNKCTYQFDTCWLFLNEKKTKQAGAELGQALVKLEVIVEFWVEDRCIYLIHSEFPAGRWVCGGGGWKMKLSLAQLYTKL